MSRAQTFCKQLYIYIQSCLLLPTKEAATLIAVRIECLCPSVYPFVRIHSVGLGTSYSLHGAMGTFDVIQHFTTRRAGVIVCVSSEKVTINLNSWQITLHLLVEVFIRVTGALVPSLEEDSVFLSASQV